MQTVQRFRASISVGSMRSIAGLRHRRRRLENRRRLLAPGSMRTRFNASSRASSPRRGSMPSMPTMPPVLNPRSGNTGSEIARHPMQVPPRRPTGSCSPTEARGSRTEFSSVIVLGLVVHRQRLTRRLRMAGLERGRLTFLPIHLAHSVRCRSDLPIG